MHLADRSRQNGARAPDTIEFIATGDRSEYVVATLRDLEAFARAEKAALAELAEQASRPLRLPSNDEVMALATDLEGCLTDDPEVGRATLRRWLSDGVIRVDQGPEGPITETELPPLMALVDGSEKATRKSGGGWRRRRRRPENSKSLERAASPGISSC
jgi:hypothetical protein